MKRNQLWSRLVVFALVTGSSALVSHLVRSDADSTGVSNSETLMVSQLAPAQMVTSADSRIQLTVPSGWQDISQQRKVEPSGLVVKSASNNINVSVTTLAKADVPQLTSELYAQVALEAGMAPFQDANVIERDVAGTLNGYSAVMHRVEGTLLGHTMVTMSYAVETPDAYHGVLVVTPAAVFESNQSEIDSVLQSFNVVEAAAFDANVSPSVN